MACLISLVMCLFMQEHQMVSAFTVRWLLVPPLSLQQVPHLKKGEPLFLLSYDYCSHGDLGQWAGVSVAFKIYIQGSSLVCGQESIAQMYHMLTL